MSGQNAQTASGKLAAVRLLAKKDPAPVAFDKPAKTNQVLKAVKPFVKG